MRVSSIGIRWSPYKQVSCVGSGFAACPYAYEAGSFHGGQRLKGEHGCRQGRGEGHGDSGTAGKQPLQYATIKGTVSISLIRTFTHRDGPVPGPTAPNTDPSAQHTRYRPRPQAKINETETVPVPPARLAGFRFAESTVTNTTSPSNHSDPRIPPLPTAGSRTQAPSGRTVSRPLDAAWDLCLPRLRYRGKPTRRGCRPAFNTLPV